jgi:hypothetical protein
MVSSRFATGAPIAAQSGDQRLAQALEPPPVAQFRQTDPAQQRPQRRISERRPVEFGEMGVAALVQQHGIADVIQRRAVLPDRQRAVGGPGEMLKVHGVSFRAALVAGSPKPPVLHPPAAVRNAP